MRRNVVRMSERGSVVIPVEIRKQLGLMPGELIALTVEGQELRLGGAGECGSVPA